MKTGFVKIIISASFITVFSLNLQAQKLKDVQEISLLAPAGVKADGKNTEWGDSFQAQNKSTNIFYTISNDDKNLYLAIKSTDMTNNTKILAGGITLSVNTEDKKKEKESIQLTYPVVNRANGRGGRRMGGIGGGGVRGEQSLKQRDSTMAAMQKGQLALVKEIQIKGFKTTTDTLISIYNEFGVKAFANINKDNSFFCEIAIPFDALGISKDNPKEFAYNIKLNGLQMPGLDGGGFGGGRGGGGGGGRGGFGGGGAPRGGIDFQALMSPTDFWGKYTIKK